MSDSYTSLSAEHRDYAANSYPGNHRFTISKAGELKPKCKLAVRHRKIRQYYPPQFTSFLDLSCNKGFFVFAASQTDHSTRNLGIDIHPYDIEFCTQLKKHLANDQVKFARLQLHELADAIDTFGGPFDTVLLINTYQYLYFGSSRAPESYRDHEVIFEHLRRICAKRIIFNNRIDLDICQDYLRDANPLEGTNYNQEKIKAAAAKHFNITEQGKMGVCPLWLLDVK